MARPGLFRQFVLGHFTFEDQAGQSRAEVIVNVACDACAFLIEQALLLLVKGDLEKEDDAGQKEQ